MSPFDTVKTVGSYVRTTSAEFRPWFPAASKRWLLLTGTVTTVPWLAARPVGMLKKAEVAGAMRSSRGSAQTRWRSRGAARRPRRPWGAPLFGWTLFTRPRHQERNMGQLPRVSSLIG